jgi:hypothetical protein
VPAIGSCLRHLAPEALKGDGVWFGAATEAVDQAVTSLADDA